MLLGNNRFPQDPRVYKEATSLAEAGYDVAVVCRRGEGQVRRETIDGIDVVRYPNPFQPRGTLGFAVEWAWATCGCFAGSASVFLRRGFDVVHAHNPPDTLFAVGAFYKLFRKRFVFDHHDLTPDMFRARADGRHAFVERALRVFERASCRLADHVIATNASYRQVEIERHGVLPERITIVRNGPDLSRRAPVPPDPELRARAKTILGYLGIMGRQDGVDHLLRVVANLVHEHGQTSLLCILVGRGDAVDSLKMLANELGIEEYVWFTGYIPEADLIRCLCTADICVDPDPSNPFTDRSTMLKMMDYMALGRPIVAFDLPEHRVTAGESAVYVEANDEQAMAAAIVELMRDPERRATMAAEGRRRIEEELAWPHSVPHLLAAYERVFAG